MDNDEALETQALLQARQTTSSSEKLWVFAVATVMLIDASFLLAHCCQKVHFVLLSSILIFFLLIFIFSAMRRVIGYGWRAFLSVAVVTITDWALIPNFCCVYDKLALQALMATLLCVLLLLMGHGTAPPTVADPEQQLPPNPPMSQNSEPRSQDVETQASSTVKAPVSSISESSQVSTSIATSLLLVSHAEPGHPMPASNEAFLGMTPVESLVVQSTAGDSILGGITEVVPGPAVDPAKVVGAPYTDVQTLRTDPNRWWEQ